MYDGRLSKVNSLILHMHFILQQHRNINVICNGTKKLKIVLVYSISFFNHSCSKRNVCWVFYFSPFLQHQQYLFRKNNKSCSRVILLLLQYCFVI